MHEWMDCIIDDIAVNLKSNTEFEFERFYRSKDFEEMLMQKRQKPRDIKRFQIPQKELKKKQPNQVGRVDPYYEEKAYKKSANEYDPKGEEIGDPYKYEPNYHNPEEDVPLTKDKAIL